MIGKTILHYKIIEKLGEGGMGEVYLAEDTKLDRKVALKFLPPQYTSDPELNKRFRREAKAAAALNHPNIVTVHEIGEHKGRTYIAMEYVEGESLRVKVRSGQLAVDSAADIAIQICEGLNAAHQAGIIHRDIKPENVIIDKSGRVRILDFGLARMATGSKLTKEATTLGTISYMSPEQFRGQPADHRADIWAVGVVLYEMLTGEAPFQGEHEQAVMYMVLNEKPAPILKRRCDLPAELGQIVSNCLEKKKGARYQEANEILTDLGRLQAKIKGDGKAESSPTWRKKIAKSRLKKIALLATISLFVMLAFLVLKLFILNEPSAVEPVSIAVIGFENLTGDSTYQYLQKAIPNLFITSLEQSPDLRVATPERLRDLSKQAGRGETDIEVITGEIGFELCRMAGIDLLVTGSYTLAGGLFVTDVKVLEVATKELIKSANSKGTGIESILDFQIDEISEEIVLGLGLASQETEKTQYKIVEVTTSSIEAYENYLRGSDLLAKKYESEASPFLQKAVEIDTTFAMAYHDLAYALGIGKKEGHEAIEQAMKYAHRATEKERLFIEATYARMVEYDTEKWGDILKRLAQNYPNEKEVHYSLGRYYGFKGMYEKAIEEYKQALELDPYHVSSLWRLGYDYCFVREYDKALVYFERYAALLPDASDPVDCIAETYFRMGRLNEAIEKYKLSFITESDAGHPLVWYCYALKEDYAEAMRWIDKLLAHDSTNNVGYFWKAYYYAWLGDLERALDMFRIIEENEGSHLWLNRLKGWFYYDRGELNLSRKYIDRAYLYRNERRLTDSPMNTAFYSFQIGLVDLAQGQVDSAAFRLAELKKLLPQIEDGIDKNSLEYRYHFLNAEILLAKEKINEAMSVIDKTPSEIIPIPDFSRPLRYNLPFLRDQLARAYYLNGELDKAIAEYERLTNFDPNSKDRYLIHPKYYYRLAKLYDEKGSNAKAISRYEKFLELWKNADQNLPEIVEAKFRYTKLKE